MLEEAESKVKARNGKAVDNAESRRRRSEKEEDAELLKEEEDETEEGDEVMLFGESPACRLVHLIQSFIMTVIVLQMSRADRCVIIKFKV